MIQLNEARDEDYWIILYVIGGTVLGLLFITIFTNICISYQIVKPLLKLTHIAEIINKIEKRTTSAEEIKRIIDFIPVF